MMQELESRPGVRFAYAFGSFLQSDAFHDIDVAVWLNDDSDRHADLELAVALSRVTRLPVDVRVANRAPVSFLFRMLRGRPLVVHDELYLADLIERTARTYHDQAPLVRRATFDAFAA
jgi:predicted nucleotidyltransferase